MYLCRDAVLDLQIAVVLISLQLPAPETNEPKYEVLLVKVAPTAASGSASHFEVDSR